MSTGPDICNFDLATDFDFVEKDGTGDCLMMTFTVDELSGESTWENRKKALEVYKTPYH